MSTTDTVLLALAVAAASIIPLVGAFIASEKRPVLAWACEGAFIIMAGSSITWLLLVGYLAWMTR